jgi:Mrp family chromosome partitioning ATPase
MSKYYDALDHSSLDTQGDGLPASPRATVVAIKQRLSAWPREIGPHTDTLPAANEALSQVLSGALAQRRIAEALAGQQAIRQLCERIAPRAVVDRSCRVAIAGCRAGDGASSVAAAFAFDLSQRLSVRTLLVDANVRAPSLEQVFSGGMRQTGDIAHGGSIQLLSTEHPKLTLAAVYAESDEEKREIALAELESVLRSFPAVVIDLGVARLDARMLPLVRQADPIMLVIRHGHTLRRELATTAAALRSADRTVAGVILNARPPHFRTSSGEHSING